MKSQSRAVPRWAFFSITVALTVAGCTSPMHQSQVPETGPAAAPAGLEDFYSQTLDWRTCQGGLECAEMTVPLDYDNPDGETIEIAVARAQARGESMGSVVINPGGPGASGVDMVSYVAGSGGRTMTSSLDVVGFDPRGVNLSDAIDCLDDQDLDEFMAFDFDGATESGRQAAAAMYAGLAQGCAENSGDLLGHVDTISSARDMDVLRALLGEHTLTYLGFSYGTKLGATYAAIFPERVGQMVLDGALDPTTSSSELAVGQAGGFESALRAYVADCQQDDACPLTGSVDDGMSQVGEVLAAAREHPYRTDSGRPLTASLAFLGVALPMYAEAYWPQLTDALTAAIEENDGSGLLALADIYSERDSSGFYANNSMEAFFAIGCADSRGDTSPEVMAAEAAEIKKIAPTVWQFFSYSSMVCDSWPTAAAEPLPSYSAAGTGPILVIGTTNDPATPYSWAEQLAQTLDAGVLVTREGEGHTAYMTGNSCITEVVDEYLVHGVVPPHGTRC